MKTALLSGVMGFVLVACSGSVADVDGGKQNDGGTAPDVYKDPCQGLGCASGPGKLVVHVLDAQTMNALASAKFSEGGQALQPMCMMNQCEFQGLSIGMHAILVHVDGYKDDTLSVQIMGPAACCGLGPTVDKTVLLQSTDPEALCKGTGGSVTTQMCCSGGKDFPDLCLIGACGCAPQNSKDTKICACGQGKCFKPGIGCM